MFLKRLVDSVSTVVVDDLNNTPIAICIAGSGNNLVIVVRRTRSQHFDQLPSGPHYVFTVRYRDVTTERYQQLRHVLRMRGFPFSV